MRYFRPALSLLLSGSMVAVTTQELFHGIDPSQVHLPPAGVNLIANSTGSITTADIVRTYDSIREAEYVQPANEKPVVKKGTERRNTG